MGIEVDNSDNFITTDESLFYALRFLLLLA